MARRINSSSAVLTTRSRLSTQFPIQLGPERLQKQERDTRQLSEAERRAIESF
jgi:hypothetical protein